MLIFKGHAHVTREIPIVLSEAAEAGRPRYRHAWLHWKGKACPGLRPDGHILELLRHAVGT